VRADRGWSASLLWPFLTHSATPRAPHRYYVKPNKKPVNRAALALVVRVGSVVEEEHERGCAHICEHLAFNGTQNYSNHDIVTFLESIGAEFGACQVHAAAAHDLPLPGGGIGHPSPLCQAPA
jgi:hypothetical protein